MSVIFDVNGLHLIVDGMDFHFSIAPSEELWSYADLNSRDALALTAALLTGLHLCLESEAGELHQILKTGSDPFLATVLTEIQGALNPIEEMADRLETLREIIEL